MRSVFRQALHDGQGDNLHTDLKQIDTGQNTRQQTVLLT